MLRCKFYLLVGGLFLATIGSICGQKSSIKKITNVSKDHYDQITSRWEWIYNKDGKHVESLVYNQNGKLTSKLTMGYNEFGKVAWEKETSFQKYTGEPDTSGCTTYYFYDEKGHYLRDSSVIFNDHFCMPGLAFKGAVADKMMYNEKDSLVEKINYQFTNKNLFFSRTVYTYDNTNKKTSTVHFSYTDDGIVERKDSTLHFYAESGNLKGDTSFHFTGDSVMYIAVDYDKYGNEIHRRRYQTMKIGKKVPQNIPIIWQNDHFYIYDKWGNWIESYFKDNQGRVGEKVVRTIEYY